MLAAITRWLRPWGSMAAVMDANTNTLNRLAAQVGGLTNSCKR